MPPSATWTSAVTWLEEHDDTKRHVDNGGLAVSEQSFDSVTDAYRWKLALASQAISDLNRQLQATRRELHDARLAAA